MVPVSTSVPPFRCQDIFKLHNQTGLNSYCSFQESHCCTCLVGLCLMAAWCMTSSYPGFLCKSCYSTEIEERNDKPGKQHG